MQALRDNGHTGFTLACTYNDVEGTLGMYMEVCDLDQMITFYHILLDAMVSMLKIALKNAKKRIIYNYKSMILNYFIEQ
jgi:hypothetical protein